MKILSAEDWYYDQLSKQSGKIMSNFEIAENYLKYFLAQKERSYSEEEVKRLAFDFYYDMSYKMGVPTNLISENATNVDVWFKQFKKK